MTDVFVELRGGYMIDTHTCLPRITIHLRGYTYKENKRIDNEEEIMWTVLDSKTGYADLGLVIALVSDYTAKCNFNRKCALELGAMVYGKNTSNLTNNKKIQTWINLNIKP
ncbi:MAG: hypothetical protein AAB870_00455 [Patescibacteria group bacterium]